MTVKGVKSTSGLSINDKVVTVKKASVNATKITISDGYTLKLGDDVFIYKSGDGIDRIFDYNARLDTIIVSTGQVDNVSENKDGDIVFTIGNGKIILDGMAGNYARVVDSNGKILKENIS